MVSKAQTNVSTLDRLTLDIIAKGADPSGTADSTAAIQAAINAVVAAGGGTVRVPVGTYNFTSVNVPSGVAVRIQGDSSQQSNLRCTSATLDAITLGSWFSEIRNVFISSNVARTAGAMVLMTGNFAKSIDCVINNDWIGIKSSGVGNWVQRCVFGAAVAGAKRIWITGGDTSQHVDANLMLAQAPMLAAAGVYTDNSSTLHLTNNDIVSQGRSLWINPGSGQGVYSLKSKHNFYDSGLFGVTVEPTGTGVVRRCTSTGDWGSSHTNYGMVFNATASAVIDGFRVYEPETHLNILDGIGIIGAGAINIRIRDQEANQNGGSAFSATNATKFVNIGLRAAPGNGLLANVFGVYFNGTCDNYLVAEGDVSAQTTGNINGHVPSITKIVRRMSGYVTDNTGSGTIAVAGTSVAVNHNLAATPTLNEISVTPTSNAAASSIANYWLSAVSATTFTVSTNVAVTGAAFTFSWSAKLISA